MGSNKTVLPENKFSGEKRYPGIFTRLRNLRGGERMVRRKSRSIFGSVFENDAKAFYHQQSETVRKSYRELSRALKERYEGGLAL